MRCNEIRHRWRLFSMNLKNLDDEFSWQDCPLTLIVTFATKYFWYKLLLFHRLQSQQAVARPFIPFSVKLNQSLVLLHEVFLEYFRERRPNYATEKALQVGTGKYFPNLTNLRPSTSLQALKRFIKFWWLVRNMAELSNLFDHVHCLFLCAYPEGCRSQPSIFLQER